MKNKKSLLITHPKIAKQWHPTKNGDLTLNQVTAGSHKTAWWKCPEGPDHEWPAVLRTRTGKNKTGCPCCRGQQVSVTNSLATKFPDIAAEWHPTKNGDLTPDQIVAGSHKKVWWKCTKGSDHEWPAQLGSRTGTSKPGCPFCAGRRVSVTNSLATQFPDIALEWHKTKNGDLTPERVVAGSAKNVWWKCPEGPDHEWPARLSDRTGTNESGCPFCAGRRVSVTNSLATQFPDIALEWHKTKNGDLTPDQVVAGSAKNVWWKCPEGPDHEWKAKLNDRTNTWKSGCPYCAGQQVSVTNSLATKFPDIAAEWHPTKNGDLTPDQIVAGSHKNVWWKCTKGPDHEWPATSSDRTGKDKTGCPCCAEYGFNPKKSALLYYLRIDVPIRKKPLYKIGITNNEMDSRIESMGVHEDVNITVLYKRRYATGASARRRERRVLEENSAYIYRGKTVIESGHTEVFTRDILKKDM